MSHSAAESQSSDASGGDDSRRNRKPEGVRCVVHVGPGAAAANAHRPGCRVYMDVPDEGEINNQAIVTDSQASGVVAAAADGHPQVLLVPEANGGDDIGDIGAFCDQPRFAADHAVVYLPRLLVTRVGGLDQLAPELTFKLIYCFLLHGFILSRNIRAIFTLRGEPF